MSWHDSRQPCSAVQLYKVSRRHSVILTFSHVLHQLTMPFTFLPATVDDASDIASIFQAAFAKDDMMSYFYPHVPASVLWQRDVKYYRDLIADGMTYGERVTKVIDDGTG